MPRNRCRHIGSATRSPSYAFWRLGSLCCLCLVDDNESRCVRFSSVARSPVHHGVVAALLAGPRPIRGADPRHAGASSVAELPVVFLLRQRGLCSGEPGDGLGSTRPAVREGAFPSSNVKQRLTPVGPRDGTRAVVLRTRSYGPASGGGSTAPWRCRQPGPAATTGPAAPRPAGSGRGLGRRRGASPTR